MHRTVVIIVDLLIRAALISSLIPDKDKSHHHSINMRFFNRIASSLPYVCGCLALLLFSLGEKPPSWGWTITVVSLGLKEKAKTSRAWERANVFVFTRSEARKMCMHCAVLFILAFGYYQSVQWCEGDRVKGKVPMMAKLEGSFLFWGFLMMMCDASDFLAHVIFSPRFHAMMWSKQFPVSSRKDRAYIRVLSRHFF